MPSAPACASGCQKPPFVDRAVVILVQGISASTLLTSLPNAYPALDELVRRGSSALLAGDATITSLSHTSRIDYIEAGDLSLANEAVRTARADLITLVIQGNGDWGSLFRVPHMPINDGFPRPRQTAGDARIIGIGVWAGASRTRIDNRVKLAQQGEPGGEGTITIAQLGCELLTKVGARPKFGA